MGEELLALYCSQVLGNIKPSNLFTIYNKYCNLDKMVRIWNDNFNKYDIYFTIISIRENSSSILCYRKNLLSDCIRFNNTKCLLNTYGYETDSIETCIHCLKKRLVQNEFPHEIGLLLGYPFEDVIGFIENEGRNYLYSGYWKVYKNKEEKCKLFNLYNQTRLKYLAAKESHIDILKLIKESR